MIGTHMIDGTNERDYYCSHKFRFLKIDLECGTTYNCHAAEPHPIDIQWLEKNPGQLFNNPVSVSERQMMLTNQRNKSCEQNCWAAEDRGANSPRLWQNGQHRTHTDVFTQPETIDFTMNSDCNLTCSYCCKEFSQSWRKDIYHNGAYDIPGQNDPRFRLSENDVRLLHQKQTDLKQNSQFQLLLAEIKSAMPTVKRLILTGGEPLLDNTLKTSLIELTQQHAPEIVLYTGLGVSFDRFVKIFDYLKSVPRLEVRVSQENTGKYAEFNRYGLSWSDFVKKVDYLDRIQVNYRFIMTMSNLTAHDWPNFIKQFDRNNILTFCYQPRFMAINVLDFESKSRLIDQWQDLPESMRTPLMQSIAAAPTDLERQGIREFLRQFVARRPDLSYDIFPRSFLTWLDL